MAQAPAMRLLRNESRGEIIGVCMGIFLILFSINTSLTYPFLGLLLLEEGQGCTLHFRTPDPRSEKSELRMTGWPQIQRRIQAHML